MEMQFCLFPSASRNLASSSLLILNGNMRVSARCIASKSGVEVSRLFRSPGAFHQGLLKSRDMRMYSLRHRGFSRVCFGRCGIRDRRPSAWRSCRTFAALSPTFEWGDREEALYSMWESDGHFRPESLEESAPTSGVFVVAMPPPNVTGQLHMGHALFVTLQDIMVRYHRMVGDNTLWLPGTDHAGIATQMIVEKSLAKEGTSREILGRDKFIERAWAQKHEAHGRITGQLRKLGASCDWTRERFTLDEHLSAAVNEAFVQLYDKGLIYKGNYMVNWSPSLKTAVSDLEVEYSSEAGYLYHFKYPVATTTGSFSGERVEHLPVATTRPETILGDTAVAVHPEDPRYCHLIGGTCQVPLLGREIPIIGDSMVDMNFGTGALKVTPGHDPNDYALGQRHNLEFLTIMNSDATMNDLCTPRYTGLDRFACRELLWGDLEMAGLALKKEPYEIRVPRSQRSGEIIEPMLSRQWFLKTKGMADRALESVRKGNICIQPESSARVYYQWMENIEDWCISRQLWWGHRIPVWYWNSGDKEHLVVARTVDEAYTAATAMGMQNGDVLRQDDDVLDTWFSSGLWPFSALGWPDVESEDYIKYYPTSVLETGYDILFFWVARMIMLGLELTGTEPFRTVYLHGLVRDDKGKKMSKSLGNVINPLNIIDKYGTDALRFTFAQSNTAGSDVNFSDDAARASRNFVNKLWNVGKYVIQQNVECTDPTSVLKVLSEECKFCEYNDLAGLNLAERWVISRLHDLTNRVNEAYRNNDFSEAARMMYEFIWGDFADWYIECCKPSAYGRKEDSTKSAKVSSYAFSVSLKLIHSIMPFVTEELWAALHSELPRTVPQAKPLMIQRFPSLGLVIDSEAIIHFKTIQALVKAIRNTRAEYNVDLGRKLPCVIVSKDFETNSALSREITVLSFLARLDMMCVTIVTDATEALREGDYVNIVISDSLQAYLPLAELVDIEKEILLITKSENKILKDLEKVQGRLSSPGFELKAPKELVENTRKQRDVYLEKLDTLQQRRNDLATRSKSES